MSSDRKFYALSFVLILFYIVTIFVKIMHITYNSKRFANNVFVMLVHLLIDHFSGRFNLLLKEPNKVRPLLLAKTSGERTVQ